MSWKYWLSHTAFIVAIFSAIVFVSFAFPGAALAQDAFQDVGQEAGIDTGRTLPQIIGTILNVIYGFLGVIFLILVIYSGFLWMTAGGNADQLERAKNILVRAVIGLLIVLSAFAITTFIFNALQRAGLISGGGGTTPGVTIEQLSGSLGGGVIRDHYPARFASDVARNTKIIVTFKQQMDIASFIAGYDTAGTPTDLSDDVPATALNTENIRIYATADGESNALASEDVFVAFTPDLQTFVFDPPVIGSPTEDVNYTVFLSDEILNANGQAPINLGGYRWTFTVGTELDLTPPEVTSVIPRATGTYDRNIIVQVDFSEAIDPTSATGRTVDGFDNIRTLGDGLLVHGAYELSNGYRTVTFLTSDECGTNSCGETMYCLPGNANVDVTVFAATPGAEPPQSTGFPYDGIVDVVGNSLDGNGDWGTEGGDVGDDYAWSFSTTNDINLSAPEIESISPDINASNIDLDQDVVLTFGCAETNLPIGACNSILMSSTVNSNNIFLRSEPEHEMWYNFAKRELTSAGEPIETLAAVPEKTEVTIRHGIFLESTDEQTYVYQTAANQGLRNQYQNCFVPAEGPGSLGGRCNTSVSEPYCCSGVPSATACSGL